MSKDLEKRGPGALSMFDDLFDDDDLPSVSYDKVKEEYKSSRRCNMVGLVDATGSMSGLWDSTRESLKEIFTRVTDMNGEFRFKWVAYRDYCDGDDLLESSGWSSSRSSLTGFVDRIQCFGGMGDDALTNNYDEAVEAALKEAADDDEASHVLLIGDAPPHPERDWLAQTKRLAEQGKPVNCFVVNEDQEAQDAYKIFKQISDMTGGVCGWLKDMDSIIDVVAMSAAYAAGGKTSLLAYEKQYQLTNEGKQLQNDLLRLEKQ